MCTIHCPYTSIEPRGKLWTCHTWMYAPKRWVSRSYVVHSQIVHAIQDTPKIQAYYRTRVRKLILSLPIRLATPNSPHEYTNCLFCGNYVSSLKAVSMNQNIMQQLKLIWCHTEHAVALPSMTQCVPNPLCPKVTHFPTWLPLRPQVRKRTKQSIGVPFFMLLIIISEHRFLSCMMHRENHRCENTIANKRFLQE